MILSIILLSLRFHSLARRPLSRTSLGDSTSESSRHAKIFRHDQRGPLASGASDHLRCRSGVSVCNATQLSSDGGFAALSPLEENARPKGHSRNGLWRILQGP